MESFTRSIGWLFINIDTLLLVLITFGFILLFCNAKKWGKRFFLTGLLGLFFCAVVPLGIWMLVALENRFPQPQTLPDNTVGIILLGGSFDFMTMEGRQTPAYNLAGGRFLEFIAVTKKIPHLKRVFSGGGRDLPTIHGKKMGEADIAKMILSDLGFETQGMIFEGTSRTTLENAIKTKELLKPKPNEKWVLMTSAFHLPRAVGLFRKAGFDVVPYPVDYHTSGKYDPLFFLGLRDGLLSLHYATREWVSLIQNYVYGRSDEIFPEVK